MNRVAATGRQVLEPNLAVFGCDRVNFNTPTHCNTHRDGSDVVALALEIRTHHEFNAKRIEAK